MTTCLLNPELVTGSKPSKRMETDLLGLHIHFIVLGNLPFWFPFSSPLIAKKIFSSRSLKCQVGFYYFELLIFTSSPSPRKKPPHVPFFSLQYYIVIV
jgi:hypothetical protein